MDNKDRLTAKYEAKHKTQLTMVHIEGCRQCGKATYNPFSGSFNADIVDSCYKGSRSKQYRVYKFTCPYCGHTFIRRIKGI